MYMYAVYVRSNSVLTVVCKYQLLALHSTISVSVAHLNAGILVRTD